MALTDKVTTRIATSRLVQLTRPEATNATTVDTTILAAAAADAEAIIEVKAGVEYDDTDARHVATAIEGVVLHLERYAGRRDNDRWEAWMRDVESLGRVTGRDRILPETNSKMEPTEERQGTKPDFDPQTFDGLRMRANPSRFGDRSRDIYEE